MPVKPEQPRKLIWLVGSLVRLAAKAELAEKIIAEIQRRRLTQTQAAAILGIDQPKVSDLKQGKLSGFSIERLMRLLLVFGLDIEITVKSKSKIAGQASRCLKVWSEPADDQQVVN